MKKFSKRQAFIIGGATAVTLLIGIPAFAATTASSTTAHHSGTAKGFHKFSGVMGTISAINGSTITVKNQKGTIYTVDASKATIQKGLGKNATTLALANVEVNDKVAVIGTVTGTTVAATKIDDGITAFAHAKIAHATNAAFGTVASVNGSTITLTHKTKTGTKNVTVTTTSSTVYKSSGKAGSASDITSGERIVAMGTKDSSGNITNATTVNVFKGAAKKSS